jgi:hypothetical protein
MIHTGSVWFFRTDPVWIMKLTTAAEPSAARHGECRLFVDGCVGN